MRLRPKLEHSVIRASFATTDNERNQLMFKSLLSFLAAGLCEIGGGYLVWLTLRESKSVWLAVVGAVILILYGVIPTLQPANFGRVYAAYGGVFIVLSILWGWRVDKVVPDRFDITGGIVALAGVFIVMNWPTR